MKIVGQLKAILGLDKSKYDKGLKGAKKSTQSFGNSVKKIGGIIAGAFAVRKIIQFGQKAVEAANIQAQAEQKLASQVAANGKAVQATMTDYKNYASELQKITTVGDETTLQLLQMAETMQSPAPKEAAKGAIALSKSLGVDLQSALKMVTLAQEGEYTMLNRYVPALRAASTEAEKAAILQKTLADGFEIAKTEALTGSGAITQMQNALGDVSEQVGNALLPVLVKMANRIKEAAVWVQENKDAVLKWAKGIGIAAGALGVAKIAMLAFNAAMSANPIVIVIASLVALGSAIVGAWKKSEKFRAIVKTVAANIAYFFKAAGIEIKYSFKILWEKIKGYFKAIGDGAKVLWKTIETAFKEGISAAKKTFADGFKKIADNMSNAGAEGRAAMQKELDAIKPPSYKEILAKEQAVASAKDTGKAAGEAFAKAFKKGASGGGDDRPKPLDPLDSKSPKKVDTDNELPGLADVGPSIERNKQKLAEYFASLIEKSKKTKEEMLQDAIETFDQIKQVMGNVSDYYRAQKEAELAKAEEVAQAQGKSEEWLAKKKEKINKEHARKEKRLAVAMAIINVAQGVTKAIAQGGIMGVIMGALVAAAGAYQIATIKSQPMAKGGVVPGGFPNDTYPAALTSGETVIPPGKLPDMAGGNNGQLTTRISGRDLEIILNQWSKDKRRIS